MDNSPDGHGLNVVDGLLKKSKILRSQMISPYKIFLAGLWSFKIRNNIFHLTAFKN